MEFYKLPVFMSEAIAIWLFYICLSHLKKIEFTLMSLLIVLGAILTLSAWNVISLGSLIGNRGGFLLANYFLTLTTLAVIDLPKKYEVSSKKILWLLSILSVWALVVSRSNENAYFIIRDAPKTLPLP